MTEAAPSLTDMQTPQVVVETKFMQNYRVASAVNGGGEVIAICNGSGQVELFTIGTDNTVWNFYPDPISETGYSGISTGLQAVAVSAGVDSQGHIVVFAAFELQLFYIVETNTPNSRWSTPTTVQVPLPTNATKIARIIMQEIAGSLYVGVLTQFKSAMGNLYSLAYSVWQTSQPSFQSTSTNLSSLNSVWLGNSAQSAAFACVDTVIVAYVVSTGQVTRYPMATTFQSIGVDAATDSTGNNQVFAILVDGNIYHLVGGGNNQPYSWTQLSQGMIFRQIVVEVDSSGNAQIFAVSGNNVLYHWELAANSPTGYSYPPAPIHTGVALLGGAGNEGGDIDLFAIGNAQSSLTHLFQEEASGNWAAQAVEVPTSGQVEQYISYTSDVTVYDVAGVLLVNSPISIWASEETRVTVNGATYFVDPHRPARTSTNSAGILSIAQETDSLAIPSLQINLTSVMSPGQSIAIRQSADIQNRLATVGGTNLMNAKDAAGNYLLADKYRNEGTTNSLASAFNQCMKLPATPPTQATPYVLTRQGSKPGVWFRPSGSAADLGRIAAPLAEQHWRLSFEGSNVTYQSLTQEEADALLVEKRASLPEASGFLDWLEDIGDFVEGVVEGIINVVDTVVHTVVEGINAVFTFIVNGITYLFDVVVTFIEQAFDIVEAIFAQVKVFFEKVFEWLGFLFSWPDILRTHEALAYTINQFLNFLQGSAVGIQTLVDNGIGNLQSQITTLFDQAVQNIAGQSTVGGYEKSNQQSSPQFSSALSNNIVYNGLVDNAGSATLSSSLMSAVDTDPLNQFMQQLTNFATASEASTAFASAKTYFQNLGGSPDQIFSQLLAALFRVVEGVIHAIISGVQALVDAMLQLVQTLVASLQAALNESWDIPFVSQLYSWITNGAKLTTLDLIALIIAIPTTIVYKILYNASPFPTEDSVTTFKNSFNAQSMLRAAGFVRVARSTERDLTTNGGLLPKEVGVLLAVGGLVSSFFYGALSAILDGSPTAPAVLSKAAFVMETAAQVFSFPWFTSSGRPDCNTADGSSKTMWIYVNLGILLDAVFIAIEGKISENANDIGVVIAFFYGVFHIPFAILASAGQSGLPVAGNVLPLIPELAKILRLSGIVEATEGGSLVVVAVIDALFMTASAIISFLLAIPQPGESMLVIV